MYVSMSDMDLTEASFGQQHQRDIPDVVTATLPPVLTVLARRQKRCSSAVES